MRFKNQFLDILRNCFLEQLVLEHARGEVMALSNTQRVISRTITEPSSNSAQNTITFRSLRERKYNNLASNFKEKKSVTYREITNNNNKVNVPRTILPKLKSKLGNCNPGICNKAQFLSLSLSLSVG